MALFFFKQKTAYEMRISDWSSDVCSSDLVADRASDPLVPVVRDQRRSPGIVAQLTRFVRTPLRLADTTALLPSRRSVGVGACNRSSFCSQTAPFPADRQRDV